MKLVPSATHLVRVGKAIQPYAAFAIPCGFVSFFFVIIGMLTLEKNPMEAQTLLTVTITVMVVLVILNFINAVLLRARKVAGQPVTAERFALISDELSARGIKNARRFMEAHREYDVALYELASDLYRAVGEEKAIELASLVYVVDSEPERARGALTAIVNDRGVTTKDEARALLYEMLNTKQAVSSGAL